MITNATVTAITAPGVPDGWSKQTYPSPTAIAARAALAKVTSNQRITLAATIANATAALYLLKSALPAGQAEPKRDHQVKVLLDGETVAATYLVEHVENWEKAGGLSHWQLFLRRA